MTFVRLSPNQLVSLEAKIEIVADATGVTINMAVGNGIMETVLPGVTLDSVISKLIESGYSVK